MLFCKNTNEVFATQLQQAKFILKKPWIQIRSNTVFYDEIFNGIKYNSIIIVKDQTDSGFM